MSQFYQIKTFDKSPLKLDDARVFLKVISRSDDTVIQKMIDATVQYGETYTGREFRGNTWTVYLNSFTPRITLCKNPVDTIISVDYLLNGVQTTVPATDYYLAHHTQYSEILLADGKSWPTPDSAEQSIAVEFKTKSHYRTTEILEALTRHVSYLYANRDDCPATEEAAKLLGITTLYDQFRITRI